MMNKKTRPTDQYQFDLSPERLQELARIREEVSAAAFDLGYREMLAHLPEVPVMTALGALFAKQEQAREQAA